MRSFSFHQVDLVEVERRSHDGHTWLEVAITYSDGQTDRLAFHDGGKAPKFVDLDSLS